MVQLGHAIFVRRISGENIIKMRELLIMHHCILWRPLGDEFCMSNSLNKCDVYYTINRGKIGLSNEMLHFDGIKNTKEAKFERTTLLNKGNNR